MTSASSLGVYVHIPFCSHRCHYCDFNTYEGLDALHAPYADALVGHIESWRNRLRALLGPRVEELSGATSVSFGGGTPTLLAPAALARILSAVGTSVGLAPDAEVTIEANPDTVDERVFERLLEAGFNRFSIGVQSTAADLLTKLGRTHSAERALVAVRAAQRAGAPSVNADLIYGSPWETDLQWRQSLDDVIETGVDHISAYALTVEEGTPLARRVSSGRAPNIDPDVQASRYEVARSVLADAGYLRYETSNWARPARECRHNLLYWDGGNYLAFGAGAHGHVDGVRWWCERLPRTYIACDQRDDPGIAGMERLSPDERAGEALSLAMRLDAGLDVASFEARFGRTWLDDRRAALESLERDGWLESRAGRLRVAERATFIADDIVARIL